MSLEDYFFFFLNVHEYFCVHAPNVCPGASHSFFFFLQNLLGGFYIVETKTVFYSRTVVQIELRGITHLLKAL